VSECHELPWIGPRGIMCTHIQVYKGTALGRAPTAKLNQAYNQGDAY